MAPIAQQIAEMIDLLPEGDQELALAIVKKMVLAWDADYTKLTAAELKTIQEAETEMERGEFVPASAINWN